LLDVRHLDKLKRSALTKDETALRIIDSLKKSADALLTIKLVSVMDKRITPVSGNKHDYMSQAPYFWYDSSKPNGLPYLRRDGVRNPEIYKITDRSYLGRLETNARLLALAWYMTGDEKYASKAAMLLRHWFLNDDTKMNPHLDYGQAIPGINTGRGIGIIESRTLMGIVDAVGLLAGSDSWKETDTKQMKDWYAAFLNWLLTSKNGRDEHAAKNNHGTWYYAQAIDFALFTGNRTMAKELVEESKRRLDSQLTRDGQQPLELERTNALGYSTMNLAGWFTVAKLAESAGADLWQYKTNNGASIRTALDWLVPYALGKKKFTHQQINKYNVEDIYSLLMQAAYKYQSPGYLTGNERNDPMRILFFGR
jgi:hypothetical protein